MRLETDILIVGGGPAGLAAALALSTFGTSVTLITKRQGLAHTPRAHVTNQRTFEIFRDLGIEEQAKELATSYLQAPDVVYCATLAGEEFARWHAFGTGAQRVGDYQGASPCEHADFAQNLLEPLLLSNCLARGANIRFSTEYLSHTQDDQDVRATAYDLVTGANLEIVAKFLVGADGANSTLAKQLDLPMEGPGKIGHSLNVYFEAELTNLVSYRPAFLYLMLSRPTGPEDLGLSVLRPTRHWQEWLFTSAYVFSAGGAEATEEEATRMIRERIGVSDLDVRIKTIDPWDINSLAATRYSKGRVFCIGDAVHRHPPSNGLGSNLAIQDAYNLAWKLALVVGGKADRSLLATYDEERVPCGRRAVERSTKSLGANASVSQALGLTGEEVCSVGDVKPREDEQQRRLHEAVADGKYNFNAHGVEMNEVYSSAAIICNGTSPPQEKLDKDIYYLPSTRPGSHLPHAWLQVRGRKASTLDIVGKGRFALLTGIGGDVWIKAAADAAQTFEIVIEPRMIAPGTEITDLYGEWLAVREIDSAGCLLIRPDAFIAMRQWRSVPAEEAREIMTKAVAAILGRPAAPHK